MRITLELRRWAVSLAIEQTPRVTCSVAHAEPIQQIKLERVRRSPAYPGFD